MAFTRIHYDSYHNRLYCVDTTDGKRTKVDFHPTFEYYVHDKTGQSKITDIYGMSVNLMTSESKKDMRMVAESMKACESDIPEDVKYLQKTYKDHEMKVEMGNFQIATIDIEVETGYTGFSSNHPIKIRKKK